MFELMFDTNMIFVLSELMLNTKMCNVQTYVTQKYEIFSVRTYVTQGNLMSCVQANYAYEFVYCLNICSTRI